MTDASTCQWRPTYAERSRDLSYDELVRVVAEIVTRSKVAVVSMTVQKVDEDDREMWPDAVIRAWGFKSRIVALEMAFVQAGLWVQVLRM